MKFIPDERPDKDRYIEKEREESQWKHEFGSLTNYFNPKDMYNRNIITEANRGRDVLTEHIDRLRRLIEARGEYVYLVKRILDGEPCSCYNTVTKDVMRKYCLECYGTRITGGYRLYYNKSREDGKIIIAYPFSDEQIVMEDWGRDWKNEKEAWCGPNIPLDDGHTMNSYDFIVKFNQDGTEEGRFYITGVKPSRSLGDKVTYQKFAMRQADKPTYDENGVVVKRGDVIYEVPILTLERIQGIEFSI